MSLDRRDEQLRASILERARVDGNLAPGGWVTASHLAIGARDGAGQGVTADHALRLINDLVGWGLLDPKGTTHLAGTEPDLRHYQLKLSEMGWRLWMGQIDPIPGVADRRAR